jgi:hypothetical protein
VSDPSTVEQPAQATGQWSKETGKSVKVEDTLGLSMSSTPGNDLLIAEGYNCRIMRSCYS